MRSLHFISLFALPAAVLVVPALAQTPSNVSVSPSSGSGTTQSFTFIAQANDTSATLDTVYMMANWAVVGQGSCYVMYSRTTGFTLLNDTATAWLGPASNGNPNLENSQCILNGIASSASTSGMQLAVTINLTFKPANKGLLSLFMAATDSSGRSSNWQTMGTWTGNAPVSLNPPTAVSVTPASGQGMTGTFTFKAHSDNGSDYIPQVMMIFNRPLDGSNSCYLLYYPGLGSMYLMNDAANAWLGPLTPGGSGSVENSQCLVNASGSTVVGANSGDLRVNAAVQFKTAYTGPRDTYMYVVDHAGATSGWQQLGTWSVTPSTLPPSNVSVSPSSGSGSTQSFTFTASSPNGYTAIDVVSMVADYTVFGAHSCWVQYSRSTNSFTLMNDTADAWLGPIAAGATGTIGNSQCVLSGTGSSASGTGTNLAVTAKLTFQPAYIGPLNLIMNAYDSLGSSSNWQAMGTWTGNAAPSSSPPTTVSVTPSSGAGMSQTFQFVASSANGAGYIAQTQMILSGPQDGGRVCHVLVYPTIKYLYLLNDAGNTFLGPMLAGSSNSVSNSQCTLSAAGASITAAGNLLTIALPITFAATYTGTHNTYMLVTDHGGASSSTVQLGTWMAGSETITTPAAPSGPSSGSVGNAYTFTASGATSNIGHSIQYQFVWGDGSNSGWLATGTTSASHTWSTASSYTVTVQARCATDASVASTGSAGATITITATVATPTFSVAAGTYTTSQSVTISSTTSGASIRYTVDGSTPSTTNGTLYSGPVTVSTSQTLKAVAYLSGWTNSGVASAGYTITGTVATPTFSVAAGTYSSSQSVAIGSTTSGASIRYTVDGSTPTDTVGTVYSGAVTVSTSQTLKAIAYLSGWTNSGVASAGYTITGTVATPTFSVAAGTYSSSQSVAISSTTSGASIRYTVDGSTPTDTVGTVYSGAVTVSTSQTLKAIAYLSGWTSSGVASAGYTITGTVATPTFSVAAGTYSSSQSVAISSTTSGASIRYTVDGSTPTDTVGTVYSGAVTVSTSQTLKAIAYLSGWTNSGVASAGYTITGTVATPTFSVAAGTYSSSQSVAISSTTSGASIRYTVDGSTPTDTVGTLYSGPVTVSTSQTLKAIAYLSGWTSSGVASAAYTITGTVATPTFSVAAGTYPTSQSVTIDSTTSGASIRYTVDGSTPTDIVGTIYSGPVTVSTSQTLKAIAYLSGWTNSGVASAAYTITGTVATPTFSVAAGTYSSSQSVTISSTTSGASIRYTVDGSTPTDTVGTVYSGPVAVSTSQTLKAIAYLSGWTNSGVASAAYTITGTVATPTFSVAAGTYSSSQSVTMSSTTAGASIRYTVDGSTPTDTVGTVYSGAVTVSTSQTLKAIAYLSGWTNSSVASAAYTITGTVATPTFSVAAGTYSTSQSVTISSTTSDASIRYTVDGSTPTATVGTVYSGPVTVSTSQMLKAIAYLSGWTNSGVASAAYTITGTVATPTFSVPAGTYSSSQSVTISSTTSGASIRYTVDGSTPTDTVGTVYSGPVTVSTSQTLKAIAYLSGWTNSGVASAAYTITVMPIITDVAPGAAASGAIVMISGSNLGSATGTVAFHGIAATTSIWTPTSIVATVPNGLPIGFVSVVVVAGGVSSTGYNFTVMQPPSVSGVSPASGPAGSLVTITGSNFGADQSTSKVTFDGVEVPAASWKSTSIWALAPSATGAKNIAVSVGGISSTESAVFTVTPSQTAPPLAREYIRLGGRVIAIENRGVSLGIAPALAQAGTSVTLTVTLGTAAPAGGAVVTLSAAPSNVLTLPASITVAAGQTTATASVPVGTVNGPTVVTVTGTYSGVTASATVNVTPAPAALSSVTVSPSPAASGGTITITATLSAGAPTGGVSVALSAATPSGIFTLPASIAIAAGQTSGQASVAVGTVATATTVTFNGTYSGTTLGASVTVTPPPAGLTSIAISPSPNISSGGAATITAYLSSAAGTGGFVVTLSSNSSALSVPASFTVPAGQTSGSTTAAAGSVGANTLVTVTANGSRTAQVTILPPALTSVSISPSSVASGGSATITVTLAAPAPSSGAVVTLSSNNSAFSVPTSITIPGGMTSYTGAGYAGTTSAATAVTVTGTYNGQSQQASFVVQAGPALNIVKTHTGSFVQGQYGSYTVTVSNTSSTASTSGAVAVTENLPSGMTLVSQTGSGWSCSGSVCSRSDSLGPYGTYPPIAVTVSVASNATIGPAVNYVTVSGGNSPSKTTNDTVGIVAPSYAPVFGSLQPNTGTIQADATTTFTVTFTDANGASDITDMELLFNGSPSKAHACWPAYVGGAFYLADDTGTGWLSVSSGSASNSQCTLYASGSTATFSGTTATLRANIRFNQNQFSGLKYMYTYAADAGGLTTGSIFANSACNQGWCGSQTVLASISVSVVPFSSVYVTVGKTQDFTATVTGSTGSSAVTWSLPGGTAGGQLQNVASNTVTYVAPAVYPSNPVIEVRATSVADSTKYASTWVTVQPYNPAGLTLLSLLPINGSGSRRQFTFAINDTNGIDGSTVVQPFFSAVIPLNLGAGGCHMFFRAATGNPTTGIVALDSAAGGNNWEDRLTAIGTGGTTKSNGLCTVYGASSSASVSGTDYYLTLDIEFMGAELNTQKFVYLSAANAVLTQGTDWLYFGWWY